MSRVQIEQDEYYHVYNRQNDKNILFRDKTDWARFLFLIVYLQAPTILFPQIGRMVLRFIKQGDYFVSDITTGGIVSNRSVDLIVFCIMPNHFHLLLRESKEGGISKYMMRIQNAYTKYFNTKYRRNGHVFQGPFQARHIEDNDQLLYLSTYIHRNPRELKRWKNKEGEYQFSSLQDYVKANRWGKLLARDIVLSQFSDTSDTNEYSQFVNRSIAKQDEDELRELGIDT